jgi:hypothetical protein
MGSLASTPVIALEIMATKTQPVNFRGRFEFLEAVERLWPEPLKAVLYLKPKLPKFGLTLPTGLSDLDAFVGTGELQDAIWSWAERFEIRDAWIRDAAVQTVISNATGENAAWKYIPPELDPGVLEVRIGSWFPMIATPDGQTWTAFKRTAKKVFERKLELYGKETRRLWGENQPALALHAEWTVLWQRGKSPEHIRNWNYRIHDRNVSLANIQTRVSDFAEAIGLTLREGRSGPARRI